MALLYGYAIDQVLAQGGFDVTSSNSTRPVVGSWVNSAHQEMVSRSRFYQAELSFGVTTANVSEYPLPANAVEVYDLDIGGTPYRRIGQRRLRKLKSGLLGILVPGVFAPDYSTAGVGQVEIFPAADADGIPMTSWAALAAPTLTDEDTDTFVVPDEFIDSGVIDGAIAKGKLRVLGRPDLAAPFQQTFDSKTQELRMRLNSRLSGGASTVQPVA
jgi:hypothetical protein